MNRKMICLASNSPRRRELIRYLERPYVTFSVDIDEKCDDTIPEQYVLDVAMAKEKAVEETRGVGDDEIVITADTCVAIDNEILGKPKDEEDAVKMLKKLSGRTHKVCTGVVMAEKKDGKVSRRFFCETSLVTFADLTDKEIRDYVATGECADKAGAYAIQGAFSKHIVRIEGDYNNVVGFPVASVYDELKRMEG